MDAPAPFKALWAWYRRQSRVTKDLIGAIGLPVYFAALWHDALDKFLELADQPRNDAIDWLVIFVIVAGIAAKIFSIRRVIDLCREVARRRKSEAEAYQMARIDTALRQADMAMCWAKVEGRGRYRFFDRSMDEAVELLRKLGCDVGQGYLFGSPEPASMVSAMLSKSRGIRGASASPRRIA